MRKRIELLAFKGCESTSALRRRIATLAEARGFDLSVEIRLIHAPQQAHESGLYGSPTMVCEGVEYQRELRGPAGFYSRAYWTAEGFRPYPSESELLAWLSGAEAPISRSADGELGELPTLVTADWSSFTGRAERFWTEAASKEGRTIRVVDAESVAGERVMTAANVAGVPCLVAAQDRLAYGLHYSVGDARALLRCAEER